MPNNNIHNLIDMFITLTRHNEQSKCYTNPLQRIHLAAKVIQGWGISFVMPSYAYAYFWLYSGTNKTQALITKYQSRFTDY